MSTNVANDYSKGNIDVYPNDIHKALTLMNEYKPLKLDTPVIPAQGTAFVTNNQGGKNRFFPTQFFPAVFDEKISRSKQGEQSKLTNFVNSNKDEWKNNWEELYFTN